MTTKELIADIYPLSPMQEGMLFHTLYAPGAGMYLLQTRCRLAGEVDAGTLARAWRRAVERTPILRTAFLWENLDKPVQVVYRRAEPPVEVRDLRGLNEAAQEREVHDLLAADRARGFDLAAPPLLRLALLRLDEWRYELLWTYHHLLLDAWSGPQLLAEVFADYAELAAGRELAPPFRRPYRDYIAWLQSRDMAAAEAFWRRRLAGFTAPTPVPSDRPSPEEPAPPEDYGTLEVRWSAEDTEALKATARRCQVTLNTLVQSAWALLLGRYAASRDVLFGVVVAGRPAELLGAESMIGLFINTLPLRMTLAEGEALRDWWPRLQAEQAEMQRYEHSPLLAVHGWSETPRSRPLFESLLVFANYPAIGAAAGDAGCGVVLESAETQERINYPLTLEARPDRELQLKVFYELQRFDAPTVGRLLVQLSRLLAGMAADPGQRPQDLPLLGPAERHQVVVEWNDTAAARDEETVHLLVERQVARTPDAVAVTAGDAAVSYGELWRRARVLAARLCALGVGPGARVGVAAERSPEVVAGLLGVLAAGGAYVPLDPAYPAARLAHMIEDAGLRVLLSAAGLPGGLVPLAVEMVRLDDPATWAPAPAAPPAMSAISAAGASPDDLAYVIYTSGSTGRSKGVEVTHRSVANLLRSMARWPGLGADDAVFSVTTLSFDIATLDLFLPLATGARVVLASRETVLDTERLATELGASGATLLQATPTVWRLLLERQPRGDGRLKVFAGGESLPPDLAERLHGWGGAAWNLYGPTETTIYSAGQRLDGRHGPVPIGRPVDNTALHVLGPDLGESPICLAGELCISGLGLARGYLGRPDLTAAAFVPDPFGGAPGGRLYRTGDLARHLPDGRIECLGRVDFQIKLRGLRIEPGEIEAALADHPGVARAVVTRWQPPGKEGLLAAYVVPAGEPPPAGELRAHLRRKLPEHMVPSAFTFLASLPVTPSGKLDRRALPAPEGARGEDGEGFVAPQSELERRIAEVWCRVLGVDRVGVHDNFFDLGGHSLLMIKAVGKLRPALDRPLSVVEAFRYPSIHQLAAHLAEQVARPVAAEHRQQAAEELEKGRRRAQQRRELQQARLERRAAG